MTRVWFFRCRSIVYLEIDNRLCSQDSDNCFPTAESAADYLGALSAREMLGKFPYPLKEVRSEYCFYFLFCFYGDKLTSCEFIHCYKFLTVKP